MSGGTPAVARARMRPGPEGVSMINTSFLLEQSEPGAGPPMGRRVGEHCEPLLAASMGGRAAWPTVRLTCGAEERCGAAPRGHARDGFKRSAEQGKRIEKGIYKVSSGCCA